MYWFKLGQGSVVLRVKILDSAATTGAGKTGLSSASSGLIISTIADNEAAPTVYTVAGSTIESITTLGTFAAPTATKCRFKEVDATNHKGLYELQIADARWAVSSAKYVIVSISGASGGAECDVHIPLTGVDPYDAQRFALTALPAANVNSSGGLFTRGSGTGQINQDANGRIDINIVAIGADTTSATNLKAYTNGTTAQPVNITQYGGTNGTFASGRPEVNTTHFAGTIIVSSGGRPEVNTVQWRGTQPNVLASGRVDATVGATQAAVITSGSFATDAIDANALAASAAAEFVAAAKAMVIETNGSITLGQAMSILLAVLAGVTTASGNTFKDPSGTTTRVTGTTDGTNQRTAVTLAPSA